MATGTFGTSSPTGITSIIWNPMTSPADLAAISANILRPAPPRGIAPGALSASGRLTFGGRKGFLLLDPGDYIGFDNWGWPIVVANQSIANGSTWTHSQ